MLPVLSASTRRHLMAAATAAAGTVHVAAAVPHFSDATLLGSGFFAIGVLQLLAGGAAVIARRKHRWWLVTALAVVNVVALAGWILSRTVGLPLGHGGPEPVGLADLTAVALETVAVVIGPMWARVPSSRDGWSSRALAGVAAVWLFSIAGAGAAVANLGAGDHGDGEEATGHPPSAEGLAAAEDIHRHDDGSVHVHTAARTHSHRDGTVHVHSEGGRGPASAATPSSGDDPPSRDGGDGHEHAPGGGH